MEAVCQGNNILNSIIHSNCPFYQVYIHCQHSEERGTENIISLKKFKNLKEPQIKSII